MRTFTIPFVIQQEEKIFGGYVSLRQFIYILLAAAGAAVFFTHIPLALRFIIYVPYLLLMLGFAFVSVYGTTLDNFAVILIRYALRNKKMVYQR